MINELHYIKEENKMTLHECGRIEEILVLPDEVDGLPVKKIEAYAFSGKDVKEIYLPRNLEEMGRYIFYRCFQLRKLCISDSLTEIGAGAFTRCRLSEIEIDFFKGKKSCLKYILDEIRYEVCVTLRYRSANGAVETAKLLFPEHYEEAVENTPARILGTRYHGSGGDYRQCFYEKELDYKQYDALLPRAIAAEQEETVVKLALFRLRYPFQLSDQAKGIYEAFLKQRITIAGKMSAEEEDTETLCFFYENGYWTEDSITEVIDYISAKGKVAVLSLLMDQRHERFPKKKKVFEL